MKTTSGNDPAFPVAEGKDGLTAREWYAGMALPVVAALISSIARDGEVTLSGKPLRDLTEGRMAGMAFAIADAMLAQAKK
jgi:hypothetical protein